ncbi:hypothetical protein ACIPJG_07920 [Streptomyces halstedii]|uniref:hypothetical protein n=1 Tax=Streptomyces TaxID=1883 RepID=UPI00048BB948|nr:MULTISPECIES: hypothetical protein [Streptomyces]MYR74525.1 hypothetical protein [Streptomyces sp. SID4925]MYY15729.1 hypothetical protein [Streptomyces sp. SID4912]MCW8219834.1 hypothetical protein [Streptomyces griseolus]SBU89822.1 hypothetical protein YUMDRAFT_00736 [Streptomyces sp. OspMP-M45]SCD60354.1 hypothetical protein GA0115241_1043205 [Streptomyces sp. DpondAA-D4]
MNQCTAFVLLSPPPHLVALLEDPEPGYVLCELGEGHDADHATLLWDLDGDSGGVWARWGEQRARLVPFAWCGDVDAEGNACELFAEHSAGHSWDVIDPTSAVLWELAERGHPHLFPEGDRPEP